MWVYTCVCDVGVQVCVVGVQVCDVGVQVCNVCVQVCDVCVRYMSQVTCRFPQACRVGNPQMAARQVVNFRARSADRSCGIRGKRKIPRRSWHHLHVGCC